MSKKERGNAMAIQRETKMLQKGEHHIGFGKIILILLTIVVIGPLIFVGTCFPLGMIAFDLEGNPTPFQTIIGFTGLIGGALLAVFVVVLVIRKILRWEKK